MNNNNTESNLPRKFNISTLQGGFRVTFYCSACDRKVTKEIYNVDNVEQALIVGWLESRKYFNRCHKCCAWVCDEHYNESVMKCVFCHPK
jgi:hypothetical protein